MSENQPTFILGFQEAVESSAKEECRMDIALFTETREQANHDAANGPRAGTMTSTSTREERDQDRDCNLFSAIPAPQESSTKLMHSSFILDYQKEAESPPTSPQMGTRTMTRMREQPDSDDTTAMLGTETITKSREESDQDHGRNGYSAIPVARS